jgi:hypothetical protein
MIRDERASAPEARPAIGRRLEDASASATASAAMVAPAAVWCLEHAGLDAGARLDEDVGAERLHLSRYRELWPPAAGGIDLDRNCDLHGCSLRFEAGMIKGV